MLGSEQCGDTSTPVRNTSRNVSCRCRRRPLDHSGNDHNDDHDDDDHDNNDHNHNDNHHSCADHNDNDNDINLDISRGNDNHCSRVDHNDNHLAPHECFLHHNHAAVDADHCATATYAGARGRHPRITVHDDSKHNEHSAAGGTHVDPSHAGCNRDDIDDDCVHDHHNPGT